MEKENFDSSFKNWFHIMWSRKWIHVFLMFFILLILQLCNLNWCAEQWLDAQYEGVMPLIMVSLGMLLPLSGTIIVAYKAFYQIFMDLKSGNSR